MLAAFGGCLFDAGFCDTHSGEAASCAHMVDCSIRPVLRTIQGVLDQVLGRLTLDQPDLQRARVGGARPPALAAAGAPAAVLEQALAGATGMA